MKRALLALWLLCTGAQAQSLVDAGGTQIEARANITYSVASGQELKLDLYLPRGIDKPVPLVVYIHGGGWIGGTKESAVLRLLPYMAMGWATANVEYRMARVAPAPAAVEDVRCALRWLHLRAADLKIDSSKVVLTGSSAGGHLALIAGMLPPGSRFDRGCGTAEADRWFNGREPALPVAAIVNWYGISDVNDLLAGPNAKHYAIEWFGSMPDAQRSALAREISPQAQVRGDTPPIITIHGVDDDVVPVAQAIALHALLEKAGRTNQLIKVPGAKHGMSAVQAAAVWGPIKDFLVAQGIR
ncbi:MAG TPA: alpha/beta hydrolase [Burkholderiaceae bacterium]